MQAPHVRTQNFSKALRSILFDTKDFTKQIVLSNVKISQSLAVELLTFNTKNRPIKPTHLKDLVEKMNADKWQFNGDNVRYSKTMVLLDGQHKLMAIAQSGKTQVLNIQSGLDDEVFDVIDNGFARTAGDVVAVAGYENHGTLSSAVKLIMSYNSQQLKEQSIANKAKPKYSNADVIDFLNKLSRDKNELLQECCRQGNKWMYASKFFSAPTYGAFAYIFSLLDREQAFFFFDLLSSGQNIGKNNHSMIYLLRQKLVNLQLTNKQLKTVDKYAVLIKSWNYYRKNKEIKQLSWQPTEDFPKAI